MLTAVVATPRTPQVLGTLKKPQVLQTATLVQNPKRKRHRHPANRRNLSRPQ